MFFFILLLLHSFAFFHLYILWFVYKKLWGKVGEHYHVPPSTSVVKPIYIFRVQLDSLVDAEVIVLMQVIGYFKNGRYIPFI